MNQNQNTHRRVVVTGIGMLTPLGLTTDLTWQALLAGKSGIGPITRFDTGQFPCKIAGEIREFDANKFLEVKEVKKHDLFSQYSIAAATEGWTDAKLEGHAYDPARVGCILGVGLGGLGTLEMYHEIYLKEGLKRVSPFLIPRLISNMGPGNVAMRYGLKGVNFTVTSACTSATHAIGESYRMIKLGIQDCVLTGGSESTITPIGIGGFCALKALSTRNEEPTKASRPFDKDRDGFVMGEGAAIIVLEELEAAKKRGAKIYAEVLGYGASCDAYHMTSPSPDGAGARGCMSLALEESGLKPQDITYINAHGTSTSANDMSESAAIKTVFGEWAKNGLVVSSTKSMTGHLLGAAGAIEAAFSVLAIRDNIVPPTINLDTPDPACDLDYVPHVARKMPVKAVMSNSFGFGGTNGSVVFGKYK